MYKDRSLDSSSGEMGRDNQILEKGSIVCKSPMVKRPIGLGLIDSRRLMRCSISTLLADYAPEFSVMQYSSCRELIASSDNETSHMGLLVLGVDGVPVGSSKVQGDIDALHQRFSAIPLILLSDRMDADCSAQTLCSKVSGYVTTDLTPAVAVAAIRLVYAGGKYFPTETLSRASHFTHKNDLIDQTDLVKAGVDGLTSRQYEVFKQLKEGKSNKLIAYELGVQESTVKVHVREIMKRLHATNRTHAVFLASKLSTLDSFD